MKQDNWWKILIIVSSTTITLAIHYGLLMLFFGHASWVHAIHGRLCYIPIVIAASWYGLRGGLWTALAISVLIQPYIFIVGGSHINLSGELTEIIFYFAIAALTGGLFDREARIRKKHEQAQRQLEQSQKLSMIGRIAAGVAHEIKNPLASIKGAFEIISDNNTGDDERREFQGIVQKEIGRIDGSIKEFLEFARPKEFKIEIINLSETLKSIIRQLENQINDAGLTIDNEIESDIYIRADQEKIRQVIINLLLNAIDASLPSNYLEVNLTRKNNFAEIRIIDSGKGIKTNELAKIFEPFYTTKPQGTGLGLAIVKSIVDRHDGDIRIESQIGAGTTVTVSLPSGGEK
jgi:two-component system sensor histidine kinase HydH